MLGTYTHVFRSSAIDRNAFAYDTYRNACVARVVWYGMVRYGTVWYVFCAS
jgi:hypothetical protein